MPSIRYDPWPFSETLKSLIMMSFLSPAVPLLEACANKLRTGVRAGPSPLKSILVGSTLVDRPAAVPAFLFIAGLAEGTFAAGDSDDIGGDGQRPTQPLRRRDAFDSGGVVGIKEKFV
jgi:hypothetical protein